MKGDTIVRFYVKVMSYTNVDPNVYLRINDIIRKSINKCFFTLLHERFGLINHRMIPPGVDVISENGTLSRRNRFMTVAAITIYRLTAVLLWRYSCRLPRKLWCEQPCKD